MKEQEILDFRSKIDEGLKGILDDFCLLAKKEESPYEFMEANDFLKKYILRGGKRLRPFLFYYVCKDHFSDEEQESILKISCALEMMHTYFLIHDDIVDRDDLRHGGLSMHKEYEKAYEDKLNGFSPSHFGFSMGILVGDLAANWVYRIILETEIDEKVKNKVLQKVSQIISDTIVGEMIDQTLCVGNNFEEDLILRVHRYKTARYTVTAPLQLGAILGGANQDELKFISDFSIPLGVAYQIRDDVLGVFGDQDKIGKPTGSDIREGKKTLLTSYVVNGDNEDDKKILFSLLGNENIGKEDIENFRNIIIDSGSLSYSENKIEELYDIFLKNLKSDERFYSKYAFMEEIAELLLKRKK